MLRKDFVKKIGVLSSGLILASKANALHNLFNTSNTAVLHINPKVAKLKDTIIKGIVLDATTNKPIRATMIVKIISNNQNILANSTSTTVFGNYEIHTGVDYTQMRSTILEIEINALGYKTYTNKIYASAKACSIHSNAWLYNANFNEKHLPLNNSTDTLTTTTLHFHLLKS